MLLNVVNKRAGEPQKLIVLLTIIIGKNMTQAEKSIQERADSIRDVIRYIGRFNNAIVVIYIDDRIIDSPMFTSHIHEIGRAHV